MKKRHPPTQKAVLHRARFFLGRLEAGDDHYHWGLYNTHRHPHISWHAKVAKRHFVTLRRWIEVRRGLRIALHSFMMCRHILIQILGRIVAAKVISHGGEKIGLSGTIPIALPFVLARELFVPGSSHAPFAAPIVPDANPGAGRDQIVVIDPLNDHPRRPGFQNVIDGRIRMLHLASHDLHISAFTSQLPISIF